MNEHHSVAIKLYLQNKNFKQHFKDEKASTTNLRHQCERHIQGKERSSDQGLMSKEHSSERRGPRDVRGQTRQDTVDNNLDLVSVLLMD